MVRSCNLKPLDAGVPRTSNTRSTAAAALGPASTIVVLAPLPAIVISARISRSPVAFAYSPAPATVRRYGLSGAVAGTVITPAVPGWAASAVLARLIAPRSEQNRVIRLTSQAWNAELLLSSVVFTAYQTPPSA